MIDPDHESQAYRHMLAQLGSLACKDNENGTLAAGLLAVLTNQERDRVVRKAAAISEAHGFHVWVRASPDEVYCKKCGVRSAATHQDTPCS